MSLCYALLVSPAGLFDLEIPELLYVLRFSESTPKLEAVPLHPGGAFLRDDKEVGDDYVVFLGPRSDDKSCSMASEITFPPRVVFVLLLVIGPEYKLNLDAIVSPLQEKKKKKKRAP